MQRGTDGQGGGIVPETSAAKVILVAPVLHSAAYACVAALAALTEMADGSCQQSAAAGVKRSAARMAKGLLLVVAPRTAPRTVAHIEALARARCRCVHHRLQRLRRRQRRAAAAALQLPVPSVAVGLVWPLDAAWIIASAPAAVTGCAAHASAPPRARCAAS